MGEVINLRQARKNKARAEKECQAEENRATHGRPKADKSLARTLKDKAERNLDAHRRGDGDDGNGAA